MPKRAVGVVVHLVFRFPSFSVSFKFYKAYFLVEFYAKVIVYQNFDINILNTDKVKFIHQKKRNDCHQECTNVYQQISFLF